MPKISVIIPVYNVEKYLKKCMDSVVNQTLKDIEIICVNDGSPDNSLAILEEYAQKDDRIKIINKENGGLSSARNTGIASATGEFIGFVDSDDWIDADFYEKLYDTAVRCNADIACASMLKFTGDKTNYMLHITKEKVAKKSRQKYICADLPAHNYVMSRIYKRIPFLKSKVLFDDGMLFEDIVFSHKIIFYLNSLVTVPNVNYNYRNHPDSIVNTKSDKYINDYSNNIKTALKFSYDNNILTNIERYSCTEKISFRILNLVIFTIKRYFGVTRFYLFSNLFLFEYRYLKGQ